MENQLNFFGKNLQYLRREKNLKQHEMQYSLGFSRTTWSNYEKGKSAPSLDGLIRIAKFFGVTLDELIAQDFEKKLAGKAYTKHEQQEVMPAVNESDVNWYSIQSRLTKLEREMNLLKSLQYSPF
jgi:transcriptional regulator with XRE-family HTH domain